MPRKTIPITGSVVAWAMEQAGLSTEDLAARSKYPVETIRAWIREEARPTVGQAKRLAEILHRPLAVLLLPAKPDSSGLPDALRRAVGVGQRDLEPEELRLTRRARRLQRLLRWVVTRQAIPPPDIPEVGGLEPSQAGAILRGWLDVSLETQMSWGDAKQAFETWRETLENLGVFVFQLQLGKGIRGFSMFDEVAPLIAVNTAENYQARSFTVFHELAHLGSRTESACLERAGDRQIERWCEETASAVLMPSDALRQYVSDLPSLPDSVELVKFVANAFKVSLRAAAVGLIRSQLLDQKIYEDVEESAPITDREKGFARGSGQRASQRRRAEVGRRPLSLVFKAFESRLLTERDVRDYLRLDGTELDELASQLQSA